MKFLSRLLLLGGYILVYAGVANHGYFVYYPWMGIFRDAYGVDSAGVSTAPPPVAPSAGTRGNSEPNDKQVPSPRNPRTRTVPNAAQRQ